MQTDGNRRDADSLAVNVVLPDGEIARDLGKFDWTSQRHHFTCATGRQFGGSWCGVPVSALVKTVSLPLETTHFVIEASDGARACVSVRDALTALMAISDGNEQLAGAPRFVARRIDGTQTIKRVRRLTPVALDAGESPKEYENE